MSYTYEYPHPAVTVDIVIFTIDDDDLKVLLIQRGNEPFKGKWALPGGFVEIDESLRHFSSSSAHSGTRTAIRGSGSSRLRTTH
jgi:8-oxo-dGTP diphosphatase